MSDPELTEFLFRIPDTQPELSRAGNIALQMGAMASRLVLEKRTRTDHPDGRAENVAEHSFMLGKVATELAEHLYPELDANLVARLSLLHDDVEAYVGDTPTDHISPEDIVLKHAREAAAKEQLVQEYAHIPGYSLQIEDYESQQSPESRFVGAVDKIMVLLIHLPNKAAVLRSQYTYSEFLESEEKRRLRLINRYPDFEEIVELRRELGQYIADTYMSDLK